MNDENKRFIMLLQEDIVLKTKDKRSSVVCSRMPGFLLMCSILVIMIPLAIYLV